MRVKILKLVVLFVVIAINNLIAQSALQPSNLTCEYLENPLGIDASLPRLSWNFKTDKKDQYQTAYEIIVSDNKADALQAKGNIWKSGKINANQNIQITPRGIALKPFTRYYWRVRTYDQNKQASVWSDVNWFETAMLTNADWKAQWITDGSKNAVKIEDRYKDDRMPLFRKDVKVGKTIASARLYISGLGYYEAYINGKKIGDHVLDPGFTKYATQVEYAVYDITANLHTGTNVTGVMLGNGWWNPLPMKAFGRWAYADYLQTGRPCFKAEIHITYTDGTQQITATDNTWLTSPGPIVKNNVYLGEEYDARLEQRNWASAGNDPSKWQNAVSTTGPSGNLTAQMQPPIKITKVVKAVNINEIKPGIFIVDMGQNFAGVVRIKVKGPAGTKIAMKYGEDIFKDGTLNYFTTVFTQVKKGGIKAGPGAPETAWQQDSYTLKGDGIEQWSPRFTFHGFRYLEITGWPGKPTLNDIEGLRMNSDLQQDGEFACSNDVLNKLHTTIQWTFLSNVFSVQSDCPGREKLGYGADMVTTSDAFLYNYNMANFYTKSIRDFANDQRPEGGMPELAPFIGIADRGYGDLSGPMGWQLGFAFLQKRLYEYYGDKQVIEQNYPALVKEINFLQSKTTDGLLHWDIGDHEAIDPRAEAFSASSFYYHNLTLAADFAGILDKPDDSLRFAKMAAQVKTLIVKKYWIPTTGRFDNGTQAAQLFALAYNFTPEDELTFDRYLDEVKRHDGHLSTGIFATKMMFDVLRERNQNDLAYSIATKKGFPGWDFMLANGATTLWESWKDPGTSASKNHPMFGSVDEWFYRSLLGINSAAPGFSKIIIKPQPAGDLTWAKGSYKSIKGLIVSDWKIDGSKFLLNVSVPPNTGTTVYIPSKNMGVIRQDGRALANIVYKDGYAIVKIGSGNYSFVAENRK